MSAKPKRVTKAASTKKQDLGGLQLKSITPKTETQAKTMKSYREGLNHQCMIGSAGTGKSFLGCCLGLESIMEKKQKRLVIIRSAVAGRELGHLPGTLHEKTSVFEQPYVEIFASLFSRGDAWSIAVSKGLVVFETTSFLRGRTIDDSVILVDEIQNCNFQELDTASTRVGVNSRLIMCGDIDQNDLYRRKNDHSGFTDYMDIISTLAAFDVHEFSEDDIVRSGFVKDYIKAKNRHFRSKTAPKAKAQVLFG